jgi:hypothetical protein
MIYKVFSPFTFVLPHSSTSNAQHEVTLARNVCWNGCCSHLTFSSKVGLSTIVLFGEPKKPNASAY